MFFIKTKGDNRIYRVVHVKENKLDNGIQFLVYCSEKESWLWVYCDMCSLYDGYSYDLPKYDYLNIDEIPPVQTC